MSMIGIIQTTLLSISQRVVAPILVFVQHSSLTKLPEPLRASTISTTMRTSPWDQALQHMTMLPVHSTANGHWEDGMGLKAGNTSASVTNFSFLGNISCPVKGAAFFVPGTQTSN